MPVPCHADRVTNELVTLPAEFDAVGVRAANPGPFSLTGTNTWVIGRDPAWIVDPGPVLEAHLAAIAAVVESRGGLAGIALTHSHRDHSEAVPSMLERFPGTPVAAARGAVDVVLADGDRFGPLEAVSTPGHAPDHLAYVSGRLALTGDAVLGQGSVFVAPDPGALRGYLDALERLRARDLAALAPGHGPVVLDPAAKLAEYIAHRRERERRLQDALDGGLRTVDELLDAAWSDAPALLRPAAALTLAAHLDKLEGDGRLPEGVQRPAWPVDWLREA
jgi:glyoxylase-like metal-dependent hydrolase (beta-lactamase superfamily II)